MTKVSHKVGFAALFFLSFVFFLYLSFPYGVLKEALTSQIQLATGIPVRIDHLGPAFPLGFNARDVELGGGNGVKVSFKEIGVRLSILQLFLMKLGVNLTVEAAPKGYVDVDVGFGIFKLLAKPDGIPSSVSVTAKSFPLDHLVSYGLHHFATSSSAGAVAGPILQALGFKGNLDGSVDLAIDSSSLAQSTGSIKLALMNASLILSDPAIGLPDQVFKTAQINGSMSSGVIKVDPTSKFIAEELEFGLEGKVNVKSNVNASDLDLKLLVKLTGGLNDKFGWVMDGLSGGASKGGNLNLQIRGTLGAPVTTGI